MSIIVSRVFSIIPIAYGVYLFAAVCHVDVPGLQWMKPEEIVGVTFIIAIGLAVPFVITYTKLGLNSAEGEQASRATKERRNQLSRACPIWNVVWYALISFVVCSWLGGPI